VESNYQLAGMDHLLIWTTIPGFDARAQPAAARPGAPAPPNVAKLRQPPMVIDGEIVEAPEVRAYRIAVHAEKGEYMRAVDGLRERVGAGEITAAEAAGTAKNLLVSAMMRAVSRSIGFRTPRAGRRPGQAWWGPDVAVAVSAKRAAAAAFGTSPSPQTASALHQAIRHTKTTIRAAQRTARTRADEALNAVFEETAGSHYCPAGTKKFWNQLDALHRRPRAPGAHALERGDGTVNADPGAGCRPLCRPQ